MSKASQINDARIWDCKVGLIRKTGDIKRKEYDVKGPQKHTDEFKLEAVRTMEQRGGRTVAEVAKELGLNPKQLYNWRNALRRRGELSAEVEQETHEAELTRLRQQVRELRMEREILKKAVFFAKETE